MSDRRRPVLDDPVEAERHGADEEDLRRDDQQAEAAGGAAGHPVVIVLAVSEKKRGEERVEEKKKKKEPLCCNLLSFPSPWANKQPLFFGKTRASPVPWKFNFSPFLVWPRTQSELRREESWSLAGVEGGGGGGGGKNLQSKVFEVPGRTWKPLLARGDGCVGRGKEEKDV